MVLSTETNHFFNERPHRLEARITDCRSVDGVSTTPVVAISNILVTEFGICIMGKKQVQKGFNKRFHHRNRIIKNRVFFRKNVWYDWNIDYPGRLDKNNTTCSCYLCNPNRYSKKPREKTFREED